MHFHKKFLCDMSACLVCICTLPSIPQKFLDHGIDSNDWEVWEFRSNLGCSLQK